MTRLPPLIASRDALNELCSALDSAACVALDTEFVRDRTYYPTLCLLQLATDDQLAFVDPLSGLDLAPLLDALSRSGLVKILHAARQDLEIFYLLSGTVPGPVFDTQLAAASLGLGDQLSYSRLVDTLLGVSLGKSHARTDWARRPLSGEQLRYAADDVLYLLRIYHDLHARLEALGRLPWLAGEFAKLTDSRLYAPAPDQAYKRIRGFRKLDAGRRARLAALAAWREKLAMTKNLPRRWIVADKPLLALAMLDGSDVGALARVPGIPGKLIQREGDALCKILRAPNAHPEAESSAPPRLTSAENRQLKLLGELVKNEAESLATSAALLATRSDLMSLVRGDRDENIVLQGWRKEVIGNKLLGLLDANEN